MSNQPLFVIFDGPPSHESGRFVEVESADGRSVKVGKWEKREDGLWSLGPVYAAPAEYEPVVDSNTIGELETLAKFHGSSQLRHLAKRLRNSTAPAQPAQEVEWHAWYRKGREHLVYFKHCGDPVPCGDTDDVVWLTSVVKEKKHEDGVGHARRMDADVVCGEVLLRQAVNRFLAWRLPEDFTPDCYVTFDVDKARRNNGWPIGTNLLTATQAEAMLRHVLAPSTPEVERAGAVEPENCPKCKSNKTCFHCEHCGENW